MSLFTRLKSIKYYRRNIIDKQLNEQHGEDGFIIPITMTKDQITLKEQGQLKTARYQNNTYNYYRWYLTQTGELQLLHLHQQKNDCTLLASFDLKLKQHTLSTSTPFHCGKDCYHAQLINSSNYITLAWAISGPKKDLYINTNYYW